MKVVFKKVPGSSEVEIYIKDFNGINLSVFVFNSYTEAQAFMSGFRASQHFINGLIQSLPIVEEYHP